LNKVRVVWIFFILFFFNATIPACEKSPPPKTELGGPVTLAFPDNGAYVGAYVEFGETEDDVTLESIEKFEKLAKKHQAIIAFSNYWGEQTFPKKKIQIIIRHHAIPLIYWFPWDKPYIQGNPPDKFNNNAIIAGEWDSYIDQWVDTIKEIEHPVLVSWGLEMNGDWFPWSGYFYGAKTLVDSGFQGPETYKKAYRHVVDRARARGCSNILWGFHVNFYMVPEEPWNDLTHYYPGSDYVDWLGMSTYGKQTTDNPWLTFDESMDMAYEELCEQDTSKPILVAEWGVGEFPMAGNKAQWISDALKSMQNRYTRVRAAVYWHERWLNSNGYYSNLRINSSPEALSAYQQGISDPFWLDQPQYVPHKGAQRQPAPAH
jgi:hypothetical protein